MKRKSITRAVAAFSALAAGISQGATVLNESFTYADGAIVGASGSPWVSHSGTSGQADIVSNALSLTSSESEDISAPLSGGPYTSGIITTTFDVTFTALPASGGNYFAHLKDSSTGFRARLTAATSGAASGSFRMGISNDGTATVYVPTDLSLNTAYSVSYSWDFATNQSTLSINGGTAVTDTDAASSVPVVATAFRQASGIGTMTVDNLVVTQVPEPSAALLGGLSLLALLRRRR